MGRRGINQCIGDDARSLQGLVGPGFLFVSSDDQALSLLGNVHQFHIRRMGRSDILELFGFWSAGAFESTPQTISGVAKLRTH